jgi:hypothetical protein
MMCLIHAYWDVYGTLPFFTRTIFLSQAPSRGEEVS